MTSQSAPSSIPLGARVVLMRHGETEWARTGKHTGRTEVPLTPLGEMQATATGNRLRTLDLRNPMILTSPRLRAQLTGDLAGLPEERTWDALSEWDYGDYEGLTTPEIRATVPDWTVWTHPCPGGEQADQIHARTDMVLSTVRSQLPERDVILIGHGHFSRALIARWLELPVTEGKRFALSPGAYSVLGYEHGATHLVHHNVPPLVEA
ncbi:MULTISPECIES: acid phosphatase [Rhodococcus]|uniref:Acid phosphatase n=1 Tax=Rhodococcus qingshengii TaxID=334542 RepID=A0AAW6LIW9_RHOSG|nr:MULTISPECIES: acid phosphatase [Rhodococcus]MBP1049653.1 acid phosphatase [Rhodococcus qingshengii]MCJ0948709.1 acid phosphatase [Rhodococcus sp. ARC_M8]MCX6476972.1 acid phosphatase [Rhodococcus sp. (in: high G+C Gram-positive bacteria)]MCZ4613418.1 acid phosphatase [Rhodococcus qingshengii]MDE8644045.1 acid phosphatase [Rhodococcus qingshengii]